MTIKELIAVLQTHPNQDAVINIKCNSSEEGLDEDMDINLNEVEVWNEDAFYFSFVELFCYNKTKQDATI